MACRSELTGRRLEGAQQPENQQDQQDRADDTQSEHTKPPLIVGSPLALNRNMRAKLVWDQANSPRTQVNSNTVTLTALCRTIGRRMKA